MGFYSNFVIPYCIDLAMSGSNLGQYRQELLKDVSGEILEIGFGTGLNLPHYPEQVTKITTVEPNLGMQKLARSRIKQSQITVDYKILNGEDLPMRDATFDSVVCTWTLCSIPLVEQAIAEVVRVLKPGGRFLFVEHGLSQEPRVQVWQNRLTPIQKVIADGCHLNRRIKELVEQQFLTVTIKQFYAPNLPKVIGYMYQGVAVK
ncbi:SAM-dependent methyltransferase [Pleurocapsa sp. CCALA 161]|uniref:class I SAM-dependent methyltransferase n=1 Tax=Pleurocapsa sp. CCALA 161 TaxID=2107688 RepID=UPI000D0523AC|nr:class I SAM-dependent methyltransferase [Pleurocapsa sp. CCALA 161]PSB10162.1 SAM-dependent methyltransferase [Pleurocapsa sp. CCALA 161]